MRNMHIDNAHFRLPENWNELTPDQYLKVAELEDREMSLDEFRLQMLLCITGLRVSRKREIIIDREPYFYLNHGLTHEFLISADNIRMICETFDFMLERSEEGECHINMDSIRNMIPFIPSPYGDLYGPADGLSNITYAEYIHAETAWSNFRKTGKFHFAVKLTAILFRPQQKKVDISSATYEGDPREAFNDFLLNDRTMHLMAISRSYIIAVVMWYEACRRFIRNKWPEVFDGGTSSDDNTDTFTSFMKQVNALADNDVTKLESIRKSYLFEVMFTLQALMVQKQKMQSDIENARQ